MEKTGACLDGVTLAAYLEGTLGHDQQAAAEVHLGDCPDCRMQLQSLELLLTSIEDEPEKAPKRTKVRAGNPGRAELVRKKPSSQRRFPGRFSALFAPGPMRLAAVSLAACLAFLIIQQGLGGVEETPFSDGIGGGVEEETRLAPHQVDGGTTVDRGKPVELTWNAIEDANGYLVRVYSSDGSVVWEGETTENRISLGAEITGAFDRSDGYEWSVEAKRPFAESIRSARRPMAIR